MTSKFSLENQFVIKSNEKDKKKGWIEVGDDRDGIGNVEIRSFNEEGAVVSSLSMPTEQAGLLAEAVDRTIGFSPIVIDGYTMNMRPEVLDDNGDSVISVTKEGSDRLMISAEDAGKKVKVASFNLGVTPSKLVSMALKASIEGLASVAADNPEDSKEAFSLAPNDPLMGAISGDDIPE